MALNSILVIGTDSETQRLVRPFANMLYSADRPEDIPELLNIAVPDLFVFCPDIPPETINRTVLNLQADRADIPVVVLTDSNPQNHRDKIADRPNLHFLNDFTDPDSIGRLIRQICESPEEQQFFSQDCPDSLPIVGTSPAARKTLRMIHIVAKSACNPILIVGETGTGKELAARAIHILRHGSTKKFVAVNCAALSASLLESELFGHVKGAFTSADRDKTGLLELAENGSIFLDEISEMPSDLQAKLLRVIQEKSFRKVGGLTEIKCTATFIASSNKNIIEEVRKGKFRQDLYYRLSICPICIPPLRAQSRKEDILLLADYFIRNSEICPEKKGKITGLTKLAAEMLLQHPWPGNVRELRNVIERAILFESGQRIDTSNLLLDHHWSGLEDSEENGNATTAKDFSLEKAEKELVAKALQQAGWQKTRAAALLGITRATLYAKVKQYNLEQPPVENLQRS